MTYEVPAKILADGLSEDELIQLVDCLDEDPECPDALRAALIGQMRVKYPKRAKEYTGEYIGRSKREIPHSNR